MTQRGFTSYSTRGTRRNATFTLCIALCGAGGTFAMAQTTQTATQPAIPLGHNDPVGKFYDVNGVKLYVEVYGSGPPLLMLHGNGGSMRAFARNVSYFAQRYTVVCVDSRAQGRSVDDPDHPLTFEGMADDFAALLDAMHVDSANVIGWSDGGIDALLLAIRHPEKVRRLVATGANVTPDADAFRPGVGAADQAKYDADHDKPRMTDKEKTAWKLFLLDFEQPHITPAQLQSIQCPSLIVCGDHDVISIAHTVSIYRGLQHANLWVVPDSGHATLIEHADEFNAKADAFFTKPFVDHK